jgi:hypothetical protein
MNSARWVGCSVVALAVFAAWVVPQGAHAQTAPVIEDVAPTSGPPGTLVQINGRRFTPEATVQIGTQTITIVDRVPNRLSVRVDAGVQSGHIAVTTAAGTVRGPEFRVTPPPPQPVIEAVAPLRGPPGTHVALRGHHFSARLTGNVVTLGGQPVVVLAATPDELQVTVPDVATGGAFTVRVDQAGEVTSAQRFEVSAATSISQVEPPRGGPGSKLTIKGRGFSKQLKQNRVYLNNTPLVVESASDFQLVVTLPSKVASGKLLVDVEGAGRAYSSEPFVVQRPPKLVDFTPKRGAPGTLVQVRGTNFGTSPEVIEATIGETKARVREAHDTVLQLEVPEGAHDARLSVRVHGVGPAWSEGLFTVTQVLRITRVAPESAAAGDEIVIEGQGFGATPARNRVTIGGQPARIIEATPVRLKVRLPKGQGGTIQVSVPGSGETHTNAPFVITPPAAAPAPGPTPAPAAQ